MVTQRGQGLWHFSSPEHLPVVLGADQGGPVCGGWLVDLWFFLVDFRPLTAVGKMRLSEEETRQTKVDEEEG